MTDATQKTSGSSLPSLSQTSGWIAEARLLCLLGIWPRLFAL